MIGFLFGAIAGGVAAYMWRDSIRGYLNQRVPNMREKAAETLEAVGKGAEGMLDRAKSTVGSNVRAGQQRLRSASGASGGVSGMEPGSRPGEER
jgi:hypothetical protein